MLLGRIAAGPEFDLFGGAFEGKNRSPSKPCPSRCVAARPMHWFGTSFLGARGTQTESAKASGSLVEGL